MSIWYTLILGLIAGILGKLIMPGKDPGGWIITILLGIAGAYLGAWIGGLVGFGGITGAYDLKSILTSVAGVVVLLALYRLIKKK